ncbi:MAG: TOMM precursor leader peptide-binding protein [Pyrinomonadaceae bacterium]|nr:TOMM precursor leader peptide-binding protein [Pyrinomonadaceae bacterium]
MPISLQNPLLPTHYSVWFDPPDEDGDEVLHFVSERRSLKLKGRSFREFHQRVIPMLNGKHSIEEIETATTDIFPADELREALGVLAEQGILVDVPQPAVAPEVAERMAPQLNLFHDLAPGLTFQNKLEAATVAVLGLSGAGAGIALALAAAGVGTIRCIDSLTVAPSDVYLSPFTGVPAVGSGRAETVSGLVERAAPQVRVVVDDRKLDSEDDLRAVIEGADIVACCLDAGQSNLIFKLNRVCLASGMRWIACSLAGAEIVAGPAMHPGKGPCYLCYRMRAVACAGNPDDAFAYERFLDRRKSDDSPRRENLVFGAGLAANFIGMEIVKELTGLAEPSLVGRILTVRLTDLAIEKHSVLRKPWCPACFGVQEADVDK